jgi:predicted ATPase/DNA-binding SARP family transcriptional activator
VGEGQVEFRILGPLAVERDGEPVAVGGPKPRALLATLLTRPCTVVSTDRLVAALWGDDPPRDAAGALRAYVSRLRAVLEPLPGSERLRFQAPGYALAVADGELDAAEFARLVASARAAGPDHAGVVDALDEALALWRGDVLAGLDPAAVDAEAEVARLDELRLAAVEARAEALLMLGRGADAVAELDAMLRRFPQREPLAALLMRAHYAIGRQAEALAVYRDLRRRLVDELGVEPSAATRDVHRRVLGQDPGLTARAPAPATNLPRRPTALVGRERDVAGVAGLLRDAPLVTLAGVGGVGKTRMALEVAGRDRDRFPDGVWLCELAPLAPDGPVDHTVAAAMRVQQRHGLTVEQTVVEYLATRRLLLVLDNCEHVLDAVARLVERIVASCPAVVVLATSREALGLDGEQVWPLAPLAARDATELFVARARAIRPGFRSEPRNAGAIAEICYRVDGLPLAIELAAARMRVMSAAEVAERLDGGRLLTGPARAAQPRHHSLTAAIDWSYRLLSGPEQLLFTRLSVFAGGADLAAVHAVCAEPGASEADTVDLLTALVDKSMLAPVDGLGGTRYRLLETLRAYGREHRPAEGTLAERHARYFAGLAAQAAQGVQGPDERAWVERTRPDHDNLRAAFEHAAAARDGDLALRLSAPLGEVLQWRFGPESAVWAERALDLAGPEHALFVEGVGAAARGAWGRGDFDRARTLAARAAGHGPGRGAPRLAHPGDVEADVRMYEGDVDRALRHYTGAVTAARRDEDPTRLVWTLYYVAICQAVRRRPELGRVAAEESLRLAIPTANPTGLSMAHYAMGLVLKKSEPERALDHLDTAAGLAAAVHNGWWQGIALMEAAATRAVHGPDPAVAARAFVEVLDHWDRIGDRTQQWLNLRYVARLLRRLGAEDDALALHGSLLAAGKPSPLHAAAAPDPVPLTQEQSVSRARARLLRVG